MTPPIQHVRSKIKKTKTLSKHSKLSQYIPETKRFNKQNLRMMLHQYQMVYVKPDKGSFGNGVMRVDMIAQPGLIHYRYQLGVKVREFNTYNQLYASLLKRTLKRKYIVQKGIHLLRYRKRPFDIRVMVQLNPKRKWETTGTIARLASPKRVVTNFHSHGVPMPTAKLLVPYMDTQDKKAFIEKLSLLGVQIAKHLHKFYPRIKEIGVDIGVDQQFNPWILEVNTSPDPYIFRRLKNKRIFNKIYRYAKAYGKYKR